MKETRSNFFIMKYFKATEMEHRRNEFFSFSVEFLFCGLFQVS